jgi:hypothetical protein
MASGFQQLIAELTKIEPRLKAQGNVSFGSNQTEHRRYIRDSLQTYLPSEQGLQDLNSIPRPENWSVSISHAKPFGAWLAVPTPKRIGFDCEERSRIRMEVIERACQKSEIESAPQMEFLWCAKESIYKALGPEQPQAITQITVNAWEPMNQQIYAFKSSKGRGLITADADLICAAYLIAY